MPKARIAGFIKAFKQKPLFFLLLILLGVLAFLDGGTNYLAQVLILVVPFPLLIIGLLSKELNTRLAYQPLIIWLFLLVFVATSMFNSTSLILSAPAFFQILSFFLLFYFFLLTVKKENFKYGVWSLFVISFLLCLLSFHYLLPWTEKPKTHNLLYATFGHNHLADYLLIVIPIILAFFLTAKKRKSKLVFGGLLLFYLLSFILAFCRGAFLVLPLVIILLFLLLKPKEKFRKLTMWFLALIPLGLLLLILVVSLSPFGIMTKLNQPENWLVKQFVKPEFYAGRPHYWQNAILEFKERPLFGQGIIWSNSAHNFYLQLLSEAGIFAFLIFLVFIIYSFAKLWRIIKKQKDPLLVGGFGGILATSLHSFLDFDWYFPAIFLTFLFLVAGLFNLTSSPQDKAMIKFKRQNRFLMLVLVIIVSIFGSLRVVGEVFYRRGDPLMAIKISPWPAVRVRELGTIVFSMDFSQGEELGQKILFLSPRDPAMHYWLGDKYYFYGERKDSIEYYEKAIEYNPLGLHHLYLRLAGLYDEFGEKEKKELLYQSFAKELEETKAFERKDHALARTLYSIAEEYLRDGKDENEVLFWWERAAMASPGRSYLRVLLETGYAEQDLRLAKSLYFIGQDLVSQGRNKGAVYWWGRAVGLGAEWSYFHLELASLYLSLGERDSAKEVLENCLNYFHSRDHCQAYLDRLMTNRPFEPPGYWREDIGSIVEK